MYHFDAECAEIKKYPEGGGGNPSTDQKLYTK